MLKQSIIRKSGNHFPKDDAQSRKRSGRLAQLVEHCVHIAGVAGSSPVPPTINCLKYLEKVD
jgi:hypothetical protein